MKQSPDLLAAPPMNACNADRIGEDLAPGQWENALLRPIRPSP
jgi:hypothetical protein